MTPEKIWLCPSLVFWFAFVVFFAGVKNKESINGFLLGVLLAWIIAGWIPYLIIKFL